MKSNLHRIRVLLCCMLLLSGQIAWSATITLNPTADTDSQSDVSAGTNPTLNASQWCHLFIKFSLSSISGNVSSAKLRIYQPNAQSSYTLNVNTTSTDTWVEGGTKPTTGSLITSKSAGPAGYVEIDITAHVQSKISGNKIVSLSLTTNIGTWTSFNSREASSNKPELVIITSDVPVTGVTVSPTSLSLTAGQTGQLTATVQPSNATNKNVSWSSSNTSVATVNSSGLVTAVAAGSATITVTTQDGGKTATCAVTVTSSGGGTQGTMTAGTNFWHIGWEGWQNTFKSGVNWSTTTDPWNPTLISELQTAKIKCLRFMDWNQTNHGCIQNWSQRIPKTANHYNVDNKLPLFVDNYNSQTNTHNLVWNGSYDYGVAYEWQIDLCNRVGADLWINIPVTATQDFQYQLATLIKNQLRSDLKVYVEWGNEIWNWGFASTVYADQQAKALGLQNVDVGAYCDPWRKYCVYASVRAFEQFERVFGTNSPRLVKVLAGQVGYHWSGYDYNHMVSGDLACLNNATINPNHITINAYAMAPYMGGQSMTEQRNALTGVRDGMQWAKNSLAGTNISLICYEGGADNYPDGSLTLTRDPQQEQLYVDYLNLLDDYCTGVFNQYTFYGGCWGLKHAAGESADINPKWRGWLSYWSLKSGKVQSEEQETASIDPQSTVQESFQLAIAYPNPSVNGTLNLSFNEKISNSDVLIRIIDATGKVVYQNLISKPARMCSISTQNFDKGLYFISIDAIGRKTVLKVMVN